MALTWLRLSEDPLRRRKHLRPSRLVLSRLDNRYDGKWKSLDLAAVSAYYISIGMPVLCGAATRAATDPIMSKFRELIGRSNDPITRKTLQKSLSASLKLGLFETNSFQWTRIRLMIVNGMPCVFTQVRKSLI